MQGSYRDYLWPAGFVLAIATSFAYNCGRQEVLQPEGKIVHFELRDEKSAPEPEIYPKAEERAEEAAEPAVPERPDFYIPVKGDTMWGIAEGHYGKGWLATRLWKYNKAEGNLGYSLDPGHLWKGSRVALPDVLETRTGLNERILPEAER